MSSVPQLRVRDANDQPLREDGQYVLYWMIANRRTHYHFGLQQAVDWARHFRRPLLVFEPLRVGYRWASDRIHRFVIDGMRDNAARCAAAEVAYYPYLEPHAGAGEGLLESLARDACVVVTDEFPCFFLPSLVRLAARRLPVRLQTVDSNGIYPLWATDRVFTMAHSFRRHLQKEITPFLAETPRPDPLAAIRLPKLAELPADVLRRWPAAALDRFAKPDADLSGFPIDHQVAPTGQRGGAVAAGAALRRFVDERLPLYATTRNEPEQEVASGLSPYLHFGHISAHELFAAVMKRDGWTPARLTVKPHGKAQGWWQASAEVESFLEEMLVWREIGYNFSSHRPRDYDRYESLPDWVLGTLAKHSVDKRPWSYSLTDFEAAKTHDPLWNAAQRQLAREGRIHNYLRMLWGKKILEWSAHPRDALATMIELNNKYALDGRNPNSYCGIFWVLGRYDRPWGPERPIFGTVRYMSSDNTAKKVAVKNYLRRYA
jgi:deoxyribodipyrimidine photo-lyase